MVTERRRRSRLSALSGARHERWLAPYVRARAATNRQYNVNHTKEYLLGLTSKPQVFYLYYREHYPFLAKQSLRFHLVISVAIQSSQCFFPLL